jgi:L-iditol 2-dehydrogenase
MKAAMLYGPRDIRIEDIDMPDPSFGEALVKIKAVGICPSDLRGYTGSREPRGGYPTIMGHEWAGDIVEVPSDCEEFKIGDRVAAMWASFPGDCYYCRKGELNHCTNRWGHTNGGFREYGRASTSSLRKLADSTRYEEAAFAEPLACCLNGHRKLNIRVGDFVAIVGEGPIGLTHVQLARLSGAARIIVSGLIPKRLEMAKKLGADYTVNASEQDAVEEVKRLTDGRGADAVQIAVGGVKAIESGIQMANIGGTVNIFAGTHPPTTISVDPNLIHYKELIVTGSWDYSPHIFTNSVELINTKRINLKDLISHVLPLEKIAEGFEIVDKREGLKVVIKI